MQPTSEGDQLAALGAHGFAVDGPFMRPQAAWSAAEQLAQAAAGDEGPLSVIGDFVLPPPDGPPSRDFQTLHLDFGLPLTRVAAADVARFTALHVPADAAPSHAATRLVPLRPLLAGGPWPDRAELLRRFARYGETHGAWDPTAGYIEGSLARLIEAALGDTPALPSVSAQPDFLCGTEFATLADEVKFFQHRGLHPEAVEIEVDLRPGELLVFDNLALAHGRRGTRRPGELHQRLFGHHALPEKQLTQLRDRVLAAFTPQRGAQDHSVQDGAVHRRAQHLDAG